MPACKPACEPASCLVVAHLVVAELASMSTWRCEPASCLVVAHLVVADDFVKPSSPLKKSYEKGSSAAAPP